MHIVIFSALYKPSIGGVENYTEQVSKALIELGHNVTIVTHRIDNSVEWEQDLRSTIVRLPCIPLLGGRFPIPKLSSTLAQLMDKLHAAACDGVLVNTRFYPLSLIGVKFARKKGLTPIILEHGSAQLTLACKPLDAAINVYEHGITTLLKHYHPQFYGVSSASCSWLAHFGIKAEGALPNAIDVPAFLSQASTRDYLQEYPSSCPGRIVSFVGRLVPEKGIRQLIDAMRLLDQQGFPATLFVAGDGPLKEELESTAPQNVVFLGSLGKPDVAALLSQSNLYCLPSRSEGFAVSLLEAAACATPSLVTRVGIAPELIRDNSSGTLLGSADANEIMQALISCLSNPNHLRSQGVTAQRIVKTTYRWRTTAIKLVNAFCTSK